MRSILGLAIAIGAVAPAPCADVWRSYEVYQPTVTCHDVIDGRSHAHKYNHCATLAWFQDRWFCLWGSHIHPAEHTPGQRIYFSTSRDGRSWSPIEQPFSSPEHSKNPIFYPEGKGHQWQPNLGVVEGELWALWNQGGSAHDFRAPGGKGSDLRGLYFSRLDRADGRWVNRRLEWGGRAWPVIGGKEYNIASTQNLYRLRSGRVLAPVTLYAKAGPAADAPSAAEGWWSVEKINSVISTDDLGKTWHLSAGSTVPGQSWMPWEPTVWEQPDGSVMMFSRNNSHWQLGVGRPTSGEYLLWSLSRDGGQTWAKQQFVPLETVCSRMHVAPLDGRGVWETPRAEDDYTGRRHLMVHNDAPGAALGWADARRNLALFFQRGAGMNFVAGTTLTAHEPKVAYPQMWRRGDTLAVCYTQSNSGARSIRVALLSPLPADDRYYIFPRFNDAPPPRRARRAGDSWRFEGQQHLATRLPIDPGAQGFSLVACVRGGSAGALLDTRTETGPTRGFSVMLGGRAGGEPDKPSGIYSLVSLPTKPHVIGPDLAIPRDGRWHYLGVTVEHQAGRAVFWVDERSQTVRFAPAGADALRGTTAHVGAKRPPKSRIPEFRGDIRFLALCAGPGLGREEHSELARLFAGRAGDSGRAGVLKRLAAPLLRLDPADEAAASRDFPLPSENPRPCEVVALQGRRVLRLLDQASAGIDLDENRRERGDGVWLRFRFRVERGRELTLCTLGDFNQAARLIARDGQVLLAVGPSEQSCGAAPPSAWTGVTVETQGARTRAWVDGGRPVEAAHRPAATWAYLGEGFPQYGSTPGTSLLVDVDSIGTRVEAGPRGAP